jgi:hypothetical protein
VIKSRKMGWMGHAARIGEMRNMYNIGDGKHYTKRPLGRPTLGIDDRIISECILG